jgi:hypothetical protein
MEVLGNASTSYRGVFMITALVRNTICCHRLSEIRRVVSAPDSKGGLI